MVRLPPIKMDWPGKSRALFVMGLVFLYGCGTSGTPSRSASMASRIAFQQRSIEGYKKFLRKNPHDPYAGEAKLKLAELLLKENDRAALEDFVRNFPKERQLVQKHLDEFILVDEVLERMNDHQALKKSGSHLTIRRGEPYYAYFYSKNYVGFVDWELGELDYYARIERVISPESININVLPETFALAERFHSLTNVYYKITVSTECPAGEYPIKVLLGIYRTIDGENEERMGGASAKHVVLVSDKNIQSQRDIQIAEKSIQFYEKEVKKIESGLSKLVNPGKSDFAAYYLYQWELSRYTIDIEKYKLFQSIALYDLKNAQKSSDVVLNQTISNVLEELGDAQSQIKEFVPF